MLEELTEGGIVGGIVAGGVEVIGETINDRIESGVNTFLEDVREAPIVAGVFEKDGDTAVGKE